MSISRMLSDGKEMTLNNTSLVVYSADFHLPTVLVARTQWMIEKAHTLVGFLSLCSSDEDVEAEGSVKMITYPLRVHVCFH